MAMPKYAKSAGLTNGGWFAKKYHTAEELAEAKQKSSKKNYDKHRKHRRFATPGLCTKCGETKPLTEFRKSSASKSGVRPECKECQNKQNLAYYYRNHEARLAWHRADNQTPRRREYQRKYQSKRWRRLRDECASRPRAERCESCGELPKRHSVTVFDHCHATNEFRGWLCDRCNRVLGLCGDSIQVLRGLAAYLENFNAVK